MIKWIHHLLNPHCEHCIEEKLESSICKSCETLKSILEISNHEKQKLLERLLEKPETELVKEKIEITAPKLMNWKVRQQMLEAEDRKRAQLLRDYKKTEELESQVLDNKEEEKVNG